jgi:hypothetical protein
MVTLLSFKGKDPFLNLVRLILGRKYPGVPVAKVQGCRVRDMPPGILRAMTGFCMLRSGSVRTVVLFIQQGP